MTCGRPVRTGARVALGIVLAAILWLPAAAPAVTSSITNSLTANIEANATITVPATTALTVGGTTFNTPFTGTTSLTYKARTTATGSGGNLTLQVTQDFQAGGPSAAAGNLSYTCGAAGLGTACGATTASTTMATNVVTIGTSKCTGGGGSCSASNPNTVVVTFSIPDVSTIKVGTYNATVKFTISAT
jgi:hypothetical protein